MHATDGRTHPPVAGADPEMGLDERGGRRSSFDTVAGSGADVPTGMQAGGLGDAEAGPGSGGDGADWLPHTYDGALTVRAVVLGVASGTLVAAMNVSFGLKAGWTQGGSLIAAVAGIGATRALRLRGMTAQEANVCQTVASAAGSMTMAGGLVGPIPALYLLDKPLDFWTLTLWGASVALFGIFFAVTLRSQLLIDAGLRFPSGTATFEAIHSLVGPDAEAGKASSMKARFLLRASVASALVSFVQYFIRPLTTLPLLPPGLGMLWALRWGLSFKLDPALMGAGALVGSKMSANLFAGTALSYWLIGPSIVWTNGWVRGPPNSMRTGLRTWLMWPGVAALVTDSVTVLAMGALSSARARGGAKVSQAKLVDMPEADQVPTRWWVGGLAVSTVACTIVLHRNFGLEVWQPIIAIPIASCAGYVAVRCSGETDVNPIGAMGKVIQLAFAVIAPGNLVANLMSAAIAAGAAGQAADLMHDFRTGLLMQLPPRTQFVAQLIGVPFGLLASVWTYQLFISTYKLGGEDYPAPAALAWQGVAQVLSVGLSGLPTGALEAMKLAVVVTAGVAMVRPQNINFTAIGLAFIIPPNYTISIVAGAAVSHHLRQRYPKEHEQVYQVVASGLISGTGVAALFTAGFQIAKVPRLV